VKQNWGVSVKNMARFLALLMGLLVLGLGISELRSARASRSWPVAPGVIQSVNPSAGRGCIVFSYTVAGLEHAATTAFFHEENSQGEPGPSCQEGVLRRYAQGQKVAVHYDPQHPEYGILEPGPTPASFVLLGVGGLFTLLGGYLVWQWLAGKLRIKPTRRPVAGTADSGIPFSSSAGDDLVTPSEVVAIHGTEFASQTLGGNIHLLDGQSEVSCRELLEAELQAALLAHEEAGTVRFEVAEVETGKPRLYVTATGVRKAWPEPSTESRLEFGGREELSAVLRRWLARESHFQWKRGAEKTFLPLVLRGIAVLSQKGRERRYLLMNRDAEAAAAQMRPAVARLLDRCREERPQVWNLISTELEKAAEPGANTGTGMETLDPWYDESAADAKRIPGLRLLGNLGMSWTSVVVLGGIFWGVAIWSLLASERSGRIAFAAALAVLIGLSEAARRTKGSWIPWTGRFRPRVEQFDEAGWGKMTAIFAPLAAVILSAAVPNASDPRLIGGVIVAAAMGGTWLLRRKAGQAIVEQVSGQPARVAQPAGLALAAAAAAGAETARPAAATPVAETPASVLPFEIEIIKPPDLPPESETSRARIRGIRERGPQVRKLYRRHAYQLVGGITAVRILAWWALEPHDLGSFPWFTVILAVLTWMAMPGVRGGSGPTVETSGVTTPLVALAKYASLLRYVFRYVRGGKAQERNRWEREIEPIRPFLAPLLGLVWSVFALLRIFGYLSWESAWKWLPAAASIGILAAYQVALRKRRKQLESAHPVYPALNLLALRVFGSPSRDLFLQLLDLWHWFGPLYRLDGPDTAGAKSSDVVAFVTGRLDKAIVENPAELEEAIRGFSKTRDSQLRFPFNSIQCNDAVWKDALQWMLEQADVVVMDLSGLAEQNRGCAYEIAKLVNEVPFERFLLLIDDETDVALLRTLLAEAASRTSSASDGWRGKLRLFHLGTQPKRREDESVYEWQRRTTTPINADRLIGLLCDAALAKRGVQAPLVVPWARPGYRAAPVVCN
jgi:hypothetical protein